MKKWLGILIVLGILILTGIWIYLAPQYSPINSMPIATGTIPNASGIATSSNGNPPLIDVANFQIDTSNWDTYTSPINKISFKYPSGWVVKEFNDNPPLDGLYQNEIDVSKPENVGPEGYSLNTVRMGCCQVGAKVSDLKAPPAGWNTYSTTTTSGNTIVIFAPTDSNDLSIHAFIGNRMFYLFVPNPGSDTTEANKIALGIAGTFSAQ